MKVIIFDLDDTLYDELTFVKSGFMKVSKFLYDEYRLYQKETYEFMINRLKQDRKNIFDDLLLQNKIYSKNLVKSCISIYRMHKPNIKLESEVIYSLKRLKNYSKYILTDGNKIVQNNKIRSLGLKNYMNGIILTSNYGLKNAKPSPYCFLKICKLENIEPKNALYIGDNPHKDFVGIKPLGFKTIRILQGQYKILKLSKKYEADFFINSLKEITPKLLSEI